MIATSPSLARRREQWYNAQQVALVNVVGAYWVGVSVASALWWSPWLPRQK